MPRSPRPRANSRFKSAENKPQRERARTTLICSFRSVDEVKVTAEWLRGTAKFLEEHAPELAKKFRTRRMEKPHE